MLNYIIADYKRIAGRIPRLFLVFAYLVTYFLMVIITWNKARDSYSSINLMAHTSDIIYSFGPLVIGLIVFITAFSYDFKAKTMQVAIGLGISRFKVIVAKLIQIALVTITDMILFAITLAILSFVTGIPLAPHQVYNVFVDMIYLVLMTCCSSSLVMFLMFKLQNMVMPMVAYTAVIVGSLRSLVKLISQAAPSFIADLHLEDYTFEAFVGTFRTNLLMGRFQFAPLFGSFVIMALGIFICWLVFRKMELDF